MTELKETFDDDDDDTEEIELFVLRTVSVKFKSDHDLMLNNTDNYSKTGSRYPKPEWTVEKHNDRVPISHSKLKDFVLEAEFVAQSEETKSGQLSGDLKGLKLTSNGSTSFPPETKVKVEFASEKPLPNTIAKVRADIAWDAMVEGESAIVTSSGQHVFFITWGDPIDEGEDEDGVTYRRMNKSVNWVGDAWLRGKRKPVEIVDELFAKFPGYVLGFDYLPASQRAEISKEPGKLDKMKSYGFAAYKNSGKGGAWPLAHYWKYGGECQAIARLIRGIIHQLGMPGKAEVKYVNADASNPRTAIIRGYGSQCTGPKPGHVYALVDSAVHEGQTYVEDGKIGWNNYEAYLKFTHGKEYWYGGGIGRLDEGQDPLMVFYGLVEFKPTHDAMGRYARQVTKVWKY